MLSVFYLERLPLHIVVFQSEPGSSLKEIGFFFASSQKLGLNFLIVAEVKILKVRLHTGRGQEKWAGSCLWGSLSVFRNKQWKVNRKEEKVELIFRGNVLLFSQAYPEFGF